MRNANIHIFDFDLVWKGMLDSAISLVHRTSWHEMTTSDLRIGVGAAGSEELKVGRILVVNGQTEKALIIEAISRNLNEPFLNITCTDLKSILNWRICHPTDWTGITQRKQSEIMMMLPFNNLVQQTRDLDRKFWSSAGKTGGRNMFGVTAIKAFGDTVDFAIDWKTGYMGDAVESIAKMYSTTGSYPIGWNIFINASWNQFVMDTYQAVDRSSSVVFSEEYGNIKNAIWNNSNKDWRNVAYMNWASGASNYTTPVGDTRFGPTVGFNRKEMIYDSRNISETTVTHEGWSELHKRPVVESFTAEIINNDRTMSTYGIDWKLGDVVTIQSRELAVQVKAQVTEIIETYDNGEYTLEATFNEGNPTLIQLIKQEIHRRT